METKSVIKKLNDILKYTDGTTMGAVIASDAIKSLIKKLESEQKLQQHGVMQAEGSAGAEGAAVGNGAAGQSGSVDLCKHEQAIYHKGYICKECNKAL